MRTEIEPQDIKAIASEVIERLKPLIVDNNKREDDILLNVKGLASYLGVDENWIYQRTRFKEIPYYKKGKYCLFRKSVIDDWLNQDAVKPLPPFDAPKR